MSLTKYKPVTKGAQWVISNLHISSPYGQSLLKSIKLADKSTIDSLKQSFNELQELYSYICLDNSFYEEADRIFMQLRNICGSLKNLEEKLVLDEIEFFEIKNFSILADKLFKLYTKTGLNLKSVCFADLTPVIRLLNPDPIIICSFFVHDSYSAELANVRRQKRLIEAKIVRAADKDEKENLKQERFFIVQKEREEELEARKALSLKLCALLPAVKKSIEAISSLEFMLSKANFAKKYGCCLPLFVNFGETAVLKNALNPEVIEALAKKGREFTPVSLEIKRGVTLITGANMGGKTVALNTAAMNFELALLGFFAFAEKLVMPVFDFIYVLSGDYQSYSEGLSSFGAEVIQLDGLIKKLKSGCGFVICDEFARSTNPFEGSKFVQALSNYIQGSRSYALMATHYDGIKTEGAGYYQVVGLKNKGELLQNLGKTEVLNSLCENMNYSLKKISENYEAPKDAFAIASILGADPEFMAGLKKLYSEQQPYFK